MTTFQAPVGTRDILAPNSARVEALVEHFASLARLFGFGLLISPMFEDAGVFRRGIGEVSEVVSKEMYEFEDRSGRKLALRPEGTASVMRAYLQHRPQLPYKAWYLTPAFRYERPQAGRHRQHHQLGVEALGTEDPGLDVEVIVLLRDYLESVGVSGSRLVLNSMGDGNCLPGYRQVLTSYLSTRAAELCPEHRESFVANPLRVLDCKRPGCTAVHEDAPRLSAHLCEDCAAHHQAVKEGLSLLAVDHVDDDFLVRGFDYYTRTTFEFQAGFLDAAQNALGGGGRYDGLAEQLGGPRTPGIGFGTGIERVLLALDELEVPRKDSTTACFVVDLTGGMEAVVICEELRRAGIATERSYDGRSLKAQLRQADRSGAALAVIVGEAERTGKTVTLRSLRGKERDQRAVARDELVHATREQLL